MSSVFGFLGKTEIRASQGGGMKIIALVQCEEMKVLIVVLLLALGLVWFGFSAERNWHNDHYAQRMLDHHEARE